METLRLFARRTVHLPSYNQAGFCIFCGYSGINHEDKMKEINKMLKGKICSHGGKSYRKDGKLSCQLCNKQIEFDD